MSILKRVNTERGNRPSDLFFIEMIIVLLFFCISGAIIMRAFTAADLQSRKITIKENAALCAQSAAEAYSISGSVEEMTERVFGKAYSPDEKGRCTLPLNTSCNISAAEGGITLILSESEEINDAGRLSDLKMLFVYNEEEIFTLSCTAYVPSEM